MIDDNTRFDFPFSDRPDLVGEAHGVQTLSMKALAWLVGKTEGEVIAEIRRQSQGANEFGFKMPKDWLRSAKEVQAKYGTNDFAELLGLLLEEHEGKR